MATIKEVAEAAGVSFKTVSRVLNKDPAVTEQTRIRVMNAVAELDYRPNFAARNMRTQQSQIIGFITDDIAITPFAVSIIRGAQSMAWQYGKLLFVINTEADRERESVAIDMLLERRAEGIIYAATYHKAVTLPAHIGEVPTVLLDCFSADRSLPSVVPDEFEGGRQATEILIQKGHRRIACLNMAIGQVATIGRQAGYRQALHDHGLAVIEDFILPGNWRPDQAYANTRQVMSLPDPPTAIFCANDWSALGAYDALRDLGLRVPTDVAVMGFDNEELIAGYMRPALSTMALPHFEMGQWAVDYLINHAETYRSDPVQHQMICSYIERGSV